MPLCLLDKKFKTDFRREKLNQYTNKASCVCLFWCVQKSSMLWEINETE